jgi:two-component system OmpR family sensor kinase
VDVAELLCALTERLEPVMADRELRLRLAEPLLTRADVDLLDRLSGNLLDNTRKYTPAGGTITVTGATEPGGARLVVSVHNFGSSIPPRICSTSSSASTVESQTTSR